MSAEVSFNSTEQCIQIKGELVTGTVMDVLAEVQRSCKQHDQWVIDLALVTRVDSTAVALLIELKRLALAQQQTISFIHLPDALMTIAHLSQAEKLIAGDVA